MKPFQRGEEGLETDLKKEKQTGRSPQAIPVGDHKMNFYKRSLKLREVLGIYTIHTA